MKHFILVIFLVGLSYLGLTNEYMSTSSHEVTLIDKLEISGTKQGKLYAVYKLKDGFVFDREISATDYSQMQIGQVYMIQIRPFDIKQTGTENLLYFFMPVILVSITLTYIVLLIINYFTGNKQQ